MTFNTFNRLTIKIVMFVVMACSITTCCSAHPSKSDKCNVSSENKDSVMRKAVGDSIYTIISEAKKIKAEIVRLEADSTSLQEVLLLKCKLIPLVKFVLSDPKIYNGSTPAYGSFMPCFSLIFTTKKETCMARFDFGLKRWAICDGNGNTLRTFDLSSDDMLRVADLLFPNNKHFQSLINTEK